VDGRIADDTATGTAAADGRPGTGARP